MMSLSPELIRKYNQPVPRYTSYPTVPLWENKMDQASWERTVKKAFDQFGKAEGVNLYIHLPFCENLCTYCGCTKRITKNHQVEKPYMDAVVKEWELYLGMLAEVPKISGIHLGGGTPTFFSAESLHRMISKILKSSERSENFEFSFEGHPNNTKIEHLQVLADLGFDRVSFGIQDFDEKVQQAIHRIQPFEKVKRATENARNLGYTSVNFDLIYGLPHQTLETLKNTFEKVAELRPERIAFYSYAHLPSAFPAQKSFERFLPQQEEKRSLYEFGRSSLTELGYEEIGMDHFALPGDPLFKAKKTGKLHRNFMGYTTLPSRMLLGLGASSISDVWIGFAQNEKRVETYENALQHHTIPLTKGHLLNEEDLEVRQLILDLICKGNAEIPYLIWEKMPEKNRQAIYDFEKEGLLSQSDLRLKIHPDGMAVVRNICTQFDLRMIESQEKKTLFSRAI